MAKPHGRESAGRRSGVVLGNRRGDSRHRRRCGRLGRQARAGASPPSRADVVQTVTERITRVSLDAEIGPASVYTPDPDRYEKLEYRRCGRSGLLLPPISLGLWQNFGDDRPLGISRAILRRAFDLGITHFDLANNYGPPYGAAEINFGRILAEDFRHLRDELVISTKAGYDMWPGPYGDRGSRKYLLASLDQSLTRMGLDYVDIFYSHRSDPDTPLEETMGALHIAVKQGKALYAAISSYSAERTQDAARLLRDLRTPVLIHEPSYEMINRWVEDWLLR